MAKIQRKDIPRPLLEHLLLRVRDRTSTRTLCNLWPQQNQSRPSALPHSVVPMQWLENGNRSLTLNFVGRKVRKSRRDDQTIGREFIPCNVA